MARKPRIQSPTNYYHIMVRGNNREYIFRESSEKKTFIDVLKEQVKAGLIDVAAYCIMDNHAHIVVEADLLSLTKAMKSTNTKYAMRFNNQRNRVGHVFQDRYRSEAIYNDIHLQQVIRYVHQNPIKANITKHLNEYNWSSYKEYIQKVNLVNENQKDFILKYFNENIKSFEKFHNQWDDNEYLETKEDLNIQRVYRSKKIISNYLEDNGIKELKDAIKNHYHSSFLINILLNESKLSHREIAELLCVNRGAIHRTKVKSEDK